MNLHEYQAKHLFANYGLPVPNFLLAYTSEDAEQAAVELGGDAWVVKAQVHAGGRGKAGGVKLVKSKEEVKEYARSLLGTNLVTFQTDAKGQPIHSVLVEAPADIKQELYLGAVIDRACRKLVIMASTEGGMSIEEVAEETPEKIFKFEVDPLVGVLPYQGRKMAFKLGLKGDQIKTFVHIVTNLGKMFDELDLALVEINPLVITGSGELVCLDGKINIDDNALYRQHELREMQDITQEDPKEHHAKEWDLSYISLDGTIGCMVNGAGLAMATMDVIKLYGGNPANFLDVGGSATQERVKEAFKIILSDDQVKGVLVNIFGGIVRCDLIAEGIISAVSEVGVKVPVVVRLEGNNADLGSELLEKSGLNLVPAANLTDAAQKIISAVEKI
tara:strand:+ start:33159 stop:34325 length:1167 start_codon:yes stop_codon:yes gene_type:complete